MATIGDRLREERTRLGLSQPAFAALGGAGKHSQIRYEAGERSPDGDYLATLAQHGADILYILTGVRSTPGSPVHLAQEIHHEYGHLFADEPDDPVGTERSFVPDDYALVPLMEAELAAGGGAQNSSRDGVLDTIAFRRDWLAKLGLAPEKAHLVRVRGDSMEPALHDRDVVLIDRARRTVRAGQVYAIRVGGEARVKRLELPDPDTLVLRSDNPAYPLEFLRGHDLEAVTILGQVIWSGHTW